MDPEPCTTPALRTDNRPNARFASQPVDWSDTLSAAKDACIVTSTTPFIPRLELRHVQLLRAGFAALAAAMITFSADHSAQLGLSVFSGFAIASALVLILAAWLTYPSGQRAPIVTQAIFTLVAGMVAGLGGFRTPVMLFSVLIAWALITGFVEAITGWRSSRPRTPDARDALTIGLITMLLGLVLIAVTFFQPQPYSVEGHDFVLTSTIIAVGIFGGYAAVIAVFLAIAGFSPRRPELTDSDVDASADASTNDTTSAADAATAPNASRDNA